MTRSLPRLAVAGLVVAALALTGCGSSVTQADQPAAVSANFAPLPGVPPLSADPSNLAAPAQALAGAGAAPTELVTQDVVVGSGTAATSANTVDVRYSGTLYADGTPFDSSWRRGQAPVSFPLNRVVPGFAQGIEGMRPGGRRVIVIPPELGYGADGAGPVPGGATLVFVVDLVGIH